MAPVSNVARLALALLLAVPCVSGAQSRLRVAGSTANNEVKLRTPSEDFRRVLRVDLLTAGPLDGGGSEALPGGVTVLVDPLQSNEGVQVPLTATVREAADGGTTADVSARQPLHLELAGRLSAAGDYTGQVVLVHEGGRETVALTVTRVLTVPTVQFVAPAPAVASSGWGWRSVEARVRLPFKETAGVGGVVALPQLLNLSRQAPDLGTAAIQPRFEGVSFELEGAAPDGGTVDVASLQGGIPVAAHGSGALWVRLHGLDGPGEYTGTVRLTVPSGAPVEQNFTLWVRSPWLWGALLIALGTLSSYGVRLYVQRIRPRALRLQRALALRRRASALVTRQPPEAQEVGGVVLGHVDALVLEIRKPVRGIRVGDADLAAVEPRLRLYEAWSEASRKLRALPEELRSEEALGKLSDVENLLRNGETPAEQLAGGLKTVRELDVVGLARAGLAARLGSMEEQARTLSQQRGEGDSLGFRLKYELLPLLDNVRAGLGKADPGVARRQLELARRSYFDILCEELSKAVASTQRPRGFTETEWRELTTEVKERLRQARARVEASVDDAFRMYQGAHAIYVRQLIRELVSEVATAREKAPTDEQRTELDGVDAKLREASAALTAEAPHEAAKKYAEARDQLQHAQADPVRQQIQELRGKVSQARAATDTPAYLTELGHVDKLLDEAEAALRKESPLDAERRYTKALNAFQSYPSSQRLTAGQVVLESFSESAAPAPGPLASIPTGGSIPSLPDSPAELPALGDLEGLPLPSGRHLWLVELGMLVLLTGLAVVLGLQLLNVFSPTWGGFGAAMTAFLWGFGLHQVGNASFEGLTGLLTRVERQGGSPGTQ
jgi:hypothetical protein